MRYFFHTCLCGLLFLMGCESKEARSIKLVNKAVAFAANESGYSKAIQLLEKAIHLRPDYNDARYYLAQIYAAQNRWGDVVTVSDQGISLGLKDSRLYVFLGKGLVKKGDEARAFKVLERGAALADTDHLIHFELGRAYEKRGDASKANTAFRNALKKKKDYLPAYLELASLYLNYEYDALAVDILMVANEVDNENHQIHHLLGVAYRQQDQHQNAIRHFQKTVALKKDYAIAYFNLGQSYFAIGNKDDGIQTFRQFIEVAKLKGGVEPLYLDMARDKVLSLMR